jgi:hypothetical protein
MLGGGKRFRIEGTDEVVKMWWLSYGIHNNRRISRLAERLVATTKDSATRSLILPCFKVT